ncbi:response regulator transcription factor [uncultured Aeromicrobium sp.]|uniref:response regulator transcription factor n=1 Tax=uncultured Aeromicrobium sp. TaxID=337820 RepID=UPI0025D365F6|nr:response regulator transcription factor [uncultured Aeromicrobium sp.]
MPTPVLLVDDHDVLVEALRFALDAHDDLECAAIARSVAEAREAAAQVRFDAVVLDLGLPDGDGTQLIDHLVTCSPQATIVVLTAHPRSDLARRARAAGAHAVLPKQGRLADLLTALRGRPVPHPEVSSADALSLTQRERDVLHRLAQGSDVRAIARELELSVHTVRDHVKSLLAKFKASSQLEAVVAAARAGVVLMEPE